jgi:hypothetical protein
MKNRYCNITCLVILLVNVAALVLLAGCRKEPNSSDTKKTHSDKKTTVKVEALKKINSTGNNLLYQKQGSIKDALRFIGMPEDRLDTGFVRKQGQLASGRQLEFANKLFGAGKSKDVDMFISLLSDGTKEQLNDGNDRRMLHNYIKNISEGTFLSKDAGYDYFVTFRDFTDKDRDRLKKHVSFAEPPTHAIVYYHFSKNMLLGSTIYLIEDNGSYKLVTDTLLSGPVIPVEKKQPTVLKEYSIVSFKQNDDAYSQPNVWKYEWNIEVDPKVSENNTFQVIKTTKVISGRVELHSEIAIQKIIDDSVTEKYKFDGLKCILRVGDSAPSFTYHNYGQKLSGWLCGISIANIGQSKTMTFPGKDVTNFRPNKRGDFVGSDLELLSFETSEKDVKYEHKFILRKDDSPEAKSAALLRLEQMTQRNISGQRLGYLDVMLRKYASDNNSAYPDRLEQLKPYDIDEWLGWLVGNVEYVGKGVKSTGSPDTVLAYDKLLLGKTGSTKVLFNERLVQYCDPDWLKRVGITGKRSN